MFKKIIILSIGFSLFLFAEFNPKQLQVSQPLKNGAVVVSFLSNFLPQKDWIAVYPKDATNAWKNVLKWSWARKLPVNKGGYYEYKDALSINKAGNYQIRYFKNNSFITHKTVNFTIKPTISPVSELYYDNENDTIAIVGFTKNVSQPNPTDWIGIYPVESDNAWENVVEWKWAKDSFPNGNQQFNEIDKRFIKLDSSKYQKLQYEARYFLNNSFTTYKKSKPFVIEANPINFLNMHAFRQNNDSVIIYLRGALGFPLFYNPKDWIGIYKKGSSNEWKNVLSWKWVKDINTKDNNDDTTQYGSLKVKLSQDEYEVRYFLNNSFRTYQSSPINAVR